MVFYRRLFAIIIPILAAVGVSGQQFHHINSRGSVVRSVYSDADGIVWVGTSSGLYSLPQLESRTPGNYWRTVGARHNISINKVTGDADGRLWLRTLNNDIFFYDPKHYTFIDDTQQMLSDRGVNVLKEFFVTADPKGGTAVFKDNRIYWLEAHRETVIGKGEHLVALRFGSNHIVALSQKNLYLLSAKEKKLLHQAPLPVGYQPRDALCISDDGQVWIWTERRMWKYQMQTGSWLPPTEISSYITGIERDHSSSLWVSTQDDGIYVCDLQGNIQKHLQHQAWDASSLLSDKIGMIYYDENSMSMWVAYSKGGLSVFIDRKESYLPVSIASEGRQQAATDVLTFAPAPRGRGMLVGLENRGVFLVGKNGAVSPVLPGGSVTALYTAADSSLWAGIYQQGLIHRRGDGHEARYFAGQSPYAIAEDDEGHLFVALLGEGVWRLDPATGKTADTGLTPAYALDLKYHHGKLYAATTEGLYATDSGTVWEKMCDGQFRHLNIDRQGYLWLLGNEGSEGLTLLDNRGQRVDIPDDLKSAPLKNITTDKEGRVWIAAPSELLLLTRGEEVGEPLHRYSFSIAPGGQQLYYNQRASSIDDECILWLGSTTGYQRIDTHRLISENKAIAAVRRLIVGSISINDKVLSPSEQLDGRIVLDKDIVYTREIYLRHNENNLVIECAHPFADGFTTDTYYYQLKGLSESWYPFDGHTIVLSSLPPGDYELLTRTQSSCQSLLLTIHIAPPFWRSWWAFCLYALMVAAVLYAGLRYYRNRQTYRQRLHELQLQQEQQAQMNEIKLRFFTNISHDLRTPLSLIISPVEELLKNKELRNAHSSLDLIHRNAEHLLSLVNQILDFRRLEFGREKLQLSYGDIASLLKDVCASFRLKAEKEHLDFTFTPSAERVETLFDRDKTTKIMMNLLSNAFKFTKAGGHIGVLLEVSAGQIIISVCDTGPGIPDSEKERIFERFYQSGTDGLQSMGSGIGLHIVREYVRLQGGDITVCDNTSAAESGSIFRFTIPLRKQEPTPSRGEGSPNAPAEEHTRTGYQSPLPSGGVGGGLLLLVDDNRDLLTYMSQALADDYSILTAQNGQEALEQLKENDVDIIVSDVMMPEMDGLELTRRVKTDINTSHIPVVLLTAKAMTTDELQGLEAGADDYITKPFSMDILRRRIQNLVERSQQHHERFAKEIDIEPSEITVTSIDEQFISRAISIVEAHMEEPDFSVEQLSSEIGLHRSKLYSKILHLTGKTPVQFIRLLRLKRGRQLLEQSGLYVSEVAYKVGFSPRNFSKYFKEEFGITPKEFTNKQEDII